MIVMMVMVVLVLVVLVVVAVDRVVVVDVTVMDVVVIVGRGLPQAIVKTTLGKWITNIYTLILDRCM